MAARRFERRRGRWQDRADRAGTLRLRRQGAERDQRRRGRRSIIYNNAANVRGAPPGMADDGDQRRVRDDSDGEPARADGLAIVGQLASGVSMDIGVDSTMRAGADRSDARGSTRRSRSSADRRSRTTTPSPGATC